MSEGRSTSALSGSGASAVSGGGGGSGGSTAGSQARSSSAISSAQAAAEAEEARLLEKEERARLQQLQRAAGAYSALEAKAGAARRVDGGSTAHARYLMGVAHSTGTAVQRRPKAFAPQQLAFDFASETPFQQHHGRSESAHQFSNAMYGADGARQERYWAAAPDLGVGRALAPVSGTGPWAGWKEPEELARLPGDEARAAGLYQAAAEDGDAAAQYSLGLSCFTGTGVAKDAHRAARCYLAAANQGHAEAQDALAFCHRYGVGAQLDLARAARLYRFAAEQGLASAQYSLGRCYHEGTGIEADERAAERWMRAAAAQGHADALAAVSRWFSRAPTPMQRPWAVSADMEAARADRQLEAQLFPQSAAPRHSADWDPARCAPQVECRAPDRFNLCVRVPLADTLRTK